MRNATQKEIDNFIEYRANHVALVQRIGSVVFGIDISDHDKDKIEANGEELNLFSLRNSMLNGTYHPHKADRAKLKRLVGKHVKSQKHHPEYWDDSITARNFDDENPPQVNAHKMPKRYLLEMVCDWCAVALKLNKPLFNWYNKTCIGENARFLFTDNQKEYIIECISRVASKIKEENLHYPKIEYTAELDSPKIDFGKKLTESKEDIIYSKESDNIYEKILHKNNKWVVTDHTGEKNLGTYDTKEEAEKRLKQVEYFKHINENEEKDIDTKESSDVESTTVNEKVITSFGGKVPISNKDKVQILKFCKKAVEDGMKPTKYTEEDMSNSANFSSGSIASNTPENTLKVINLGAEKIEEAFVICSLDGQKVEGTYTTDLNKAKEMRNELADTYKTFFKINKVADIPNSENIEEFKESTEKGKTCVFTFGRYQPPTKGHLKVWKKVGDTEGDAHYIYTSHTKDKKKNPLDYNTKGGLIESALKENNINAEVVESEAKTIIDVVVDIADKGFTDIIFVGGSDRLNDIVTLIQKYNDVPNKEGNSYHFDTIEGVSAGERDPDSDSLEGISGTKIRQFALDNDFESFKNNLAFSDESTAKEVMEIIKSNIKK